MLNAADFPTLQAAYDALPLEGGEIYLPARPDAAGHVQKYMLTATLNITKPVRFIGDGRNSTYIQPSSPTFTMFDIRTSFVHFEKLTIDMTATSGSSFDALVFYGLGVNSGVLCQGCTMREVEVMRAGRNALRLIDVIVFDTTDCYFTFNQSDGLYIDITTAPPSQGTTTLRFTNSIFSQNVGRGAVVNAGIEVTFFGCAFEGNDAGTGAADGTGVKASNVIALHLIGCYFEDPPTAATEQFVYMASCHSAVVENCWFIGAPPTPVRPLRTALFANCAWVRYSNNVSQLIASEMVKFDSECNGAVEFGNRDFEAPVGGTSRILIQGRGVLSHSSGATNFGRFFSNNRPPVGTTPGTALPGSILWREDPDVVGGDSRIQISDGVAWRNMPVVRTIRRNLFFPAITLRSLIGSNAIADQGTYPNRYSYVAWAGNSATQDGVGTEWLVPPDFATSSNLTFSIVWSYGTIGITGQNWVCEATFLARQNNDSLVAAGTTLSATINADRGATDAAFFDTIGSSTSGLVAGKVVRITVNRNAPAASDNYPGQVRFVGLLVEYSAGI